MNYQLQQSAGRLRDAIERSEGDYAIAEAVNHLVRDLGGNPYLLPQLMTQPHLLAAYLVSLALTQPTVP